LPSIALASNSAMKPRPSLMTWRATIGLPAKARSSWKSAEQLSLTMTSSGTPNARQ
jgi:hypothetical protein